MMPSATQAILQSHGRKWTRTPVFIRNKANTIRPAPGIIEIKTTPKLSARPIQFLWHFQSIICNRFILELLYLLALRRYKIKPLVAQERKVLRPNNIKTTKIIQRQWNIHWYYLPDVIVLFWSTCPYRKRIGNIVCWLHFHIWRQVSAWSQ